ncbi:response regulator [Steroidobacter sp. S1-65]|uniref:histidine kinase n=1 Tax=Steroidobacter gossypii TaxID=2805490 RepID=A0ABS1WVD1_9GAMM|nr:ATP-binding protein [Steroidobacter gossypii]MBM0104935.1 response regulator [Steroidobacter gossypii]
MSAVHALPTARILVIDDNESIHRDFRRILLPSQQDAVALAELEETLFGSTQRLSRTGFELDSAYQGEEGLAMSIRAQEEGRPYSMAFVDMRMPPGWDGVETIARLWERDPELQIAICSAYSDYSWQEMARRLDLRDRLLILKKPFDNIEIYQLATALVAKWRMSREAAARMVQLEAAVEKRTSELRNANQELQTQISERRRLEGQLALRHKLESIGQLAAGVAHEINTPIQYIGDSIHFLHAAYSDLATLQDQYEGLLALEHESVKAAEMCANVRQALAGTDAHFLRKEIPLACERALAGVDHVARIVRAMKELAHPRTHELAPADINEAIKSALLVSHNEYKYLAQLETHLGELPAVVCSVSELSQVLLNLIVNAAHAIEAAGRDVSTGRIVIRTALDGDHVTIAISDNGTGIPTAIADKIFDPFFTTKEIGKGTGQGLAIAFAVVAKHRGTLTFQSAEGQGTTFTVRLPIQPADVAAAVFE